jgi:hypothetical protein
MLALKLFIMKCKLSLFSFVVEAFCVFFKVSLLNCRILRFAYRSFTMLAVTFRSVTYFELISVEGVR